MRLSRRGVVLIQVLVAAVVIGYISAMLLRMTMQPAMTTALVVDGVSRRLSAAAAYNKAMSAWQAAGSCASDASAGVTCAGSGCACTCTVTGSQAVITSEAAGGACRVSVVAP